jgi:hypothetical protein
MSKNKENPVSKLIKTLGEDVKGELDGLDVEGLRKTICAALDAVTTAVEELEANEKYQDLKASLNDVTQATKDLRRFQGAKIKYASQRLKELAAA